MIIGLVAVLLLGLAVAVVRRAGDGDETTSVSTGTTVDTGSTTRSSTTTATPSTTIPPTTTRPTTTPSTTTSSTASSPTSSPPTGATTVVPPAPPGTACPGCVNGWIVPEPGTSLRVEPLDVIRGQMGITGRFQVIEMRYFTGPEVPWILAPRSPYVEWWYVKAHLVDDPAFRARWLVSRRWEPPRQGISAVAPFDTEGYRSPDWRAFIGEGDPHPVDGLPGLWVGMDYDFLVGDDPYLVHPGLPDEVVRCLDGT